MPFSHVTHHMEKIPGSDMSAVSRVTPIVRICSYGEAVNIQGGQFWTDAGLRIDNPPGWVYDALSSMTPNCLHEAGFPGGRAPERPDNAPVGKPILADAMEARHAKQNRPDKE